MKQQKEQAGADTSTPELSCPPSIQRVLNWLALAYLALTGLAIVGGITLPIVGWLEDYGPKSPGQWSPFPIFPFFLIMGAFMLFCAKVSFVIRDSLRSRSDREVIRTVGGGACIIGLILCKIAFSMHGDLLGRTTAVFIICTGVLTLWYLQRPQVIAVFPPEPETEKPAAR